MRRISVPRSNADATAPPERTGDALVLAAGLLTPTLFAGMIVWCACVKQLDATGLASAILVDLALWAVSAVSLFETRRAARYWAAQQRHIRTLAAEFAEWVDAQRQNWSNRQ